MMEKALIIIIFMYATSFGILGAQYVIGDVFHVTLTNFQGEEIQSSVLGLIDTDTINSVTENVVTGNYVGNSTFYDKIETFSTAAAFVAWELVLLLSGTYIFNLLYLLGIPAIIVVGMVVIYLMLLARAILAYIRGV